jgi:hypothetical protein
LCKNLVQHGTWRRQSHNNQIYFRLRRFVWTFAKCIISQWHFEEKHFRSDDLSAKLTFLGFYQIKFSVKWPFIEKKILSILHLSKFRSNDQIQFFRRNNLLVRKIVLDHFAEKSFDRNFLTERSFDRNNIWPNTIGPNAIWSIVH